MLGFSQLSRPIKRQDLLEKGKNGHNAFRTRAKIHFSEKTFWGYGHFKWINVDGKQPFCPKGFAIYKKNQEESLLGRKGLNYEPLEKVHIFKKCTDLYQKPIRVETCKGPLCSGKQTSEYSIC